jgi:ribosomal protein S2
MIKYMLLGFYREEDIQKMLSAQVHIGTRNSDDQMKDYIWRRRHDGIHILNIGKTWEKLVLAARIIVAIENPQVSCWACSYSIAALLHCF